jgi:hypothetical protein
MTRLRWISVGYFIALAVAASLNYIPGLTDENGLSFGIFELDIFDDALHVVSALWALAAALTSHRASWIFLSVFGMLYLADGALGLATGSGYLDFGIINNGILALPFGFKIMANLPHIGLGGFAVWSAKYMDRTHN